MLMHSLRLIFTIKYIELVLHAKCFIVLTFNTNFI